MRTYTEHFLGRVEDFLRKTGTKPTEFGRSAVGDASFVLNLRRGRSPTLATADKVVLFIQKLEADATSRAANRQAGYE